MKFRKKPIVVEAEQFVSETKPWPEGVEKRKIGPFVTYVLETSKGHFAEVDDGDWIATGVRGDKYPFKPDLFDETYEPVGEEVAV